jgi:hypothetical protein
MRMSKFIARFFLMTLAIILWVLIMMLGWGLEPKSWWWIIGGGVGIKSLIIIMEILVKVEEK